MDARALRLRDCTGPLLNAHRRRAACSDGTEFAAQRATKAAIASLRDRLSAPPPCSVALHFGRDQEQSEGPGYFAQAEVGRNLEFAQARMRANAP